MFNNFTRHSLLNRCLLTLNISQVPVRWVSLQYDFHSKWMKVDVRESRSSTLPQLSLVLKPSSVSIEFTPVSPDPAFIG